MIGGEESLKKYLQSGKGCGIVYSNDERSEIFK
jgi:hypothetical protein